LALGVWEPGGKAVSAKAKTAAIPSSRCEARKRDLGAADSSYSG
jgi:hypothetical protein